MKHVLKDRQLHQLDMFSLSGRTALITGASSGIGAYLAQVAARAGANVVLAARRTDRLEQVAGIIRAEGGNALCVPLDVGSEESIGLCFRTLEEQKVRLDVLVNNAGIAAPSPAIEGTVATDRDLWQVNFLGAVQMSRWAARHWINVGAPGVVVNVASILGIVGAVGASGYSATKAALISVTRTLACEWAGHSIRVNALAPGYLRTELNSTELDGGLGSKLLKRVPMRRLAELTDLAGPFLLLSSDASRYMTGSVVVVDGGQTSW